MLGFVSWLWVAAALPAGESAQVVRVKDGDTIVVLLHGQEEDVRYLGMNTAEWDQLCGSRATRANKALVAGKTVTLVRDADVSNRDRFKRLLRYVYVGDLFVNAELVRQGLAQARLYEPGIDQYSYFKRLEREATAAERGCH